MSVALLLATRPVAFEPWLGGLDKMYRLHKWLGITALVTVVMHWVLTQAPKWLAALGLITPHAHARSARPTGPLALAFRSQRGLAESLGEWAFYASVLLIVLALVKRFPYHLFQKTHRLLAVLFLMLAFHTVVLMPWPYWSQLAGPSMTLLVGAGSAAAVFILLRRVGQHRRAIAQVDSISDHPEMGILEIDVQMKDRWRGHEAGQFAFVTFDKHEGAHPFTITSAWAGDGRMQFVIKGLGDYTRSLNWALEAGDLITIEGPYGQFNFSGNARRQIWIGGGVGITPFIARMKALALHPDGKAIDLFHSTTVLDDSAAAILADDARDAHVKLHVMVNSRDGMLDARMIRDAVPDWKASEFWFCGPAGFGKALRRDLRAAGMHPAAFHQELFELR